jgi:hypothetical protein
MQPERVRLSYEASERLAAMAEIPPADPTGRDYADWVRARAQAARAKPANYCRNCGQPIRCIYRAHRGKTDCWAHTETARLRCADRPCVAEPPPKPPRPQLDAAA